MEEFIIKKIDEIINNEREKQILKENIDKFKIIYENDPLSLLDKKNEDLLNSIFIKIIAQFENNISIKNAKEIYIAYKQTGTQGIEEYLNEVNFLLLYLNKLALNYQKNINLIDTKDLLNIKNLLKENKLYNLDINNINTILEKIKLTKEECDTIKNYITKNQEIKENLLKDTPSKNDLKEEGFELIFNIAKQIFITEIDKLQKKEDKIKKLEELINNNIYGNNKNKLNTIIILSSILKEEIEEEKYLLETLEKEDKEKLQSNIDTLYFLFYYLKEKEEKEESENKEEKDTYFDYQNHKNKVIYLSSNILKDIENINEPKTIKDIYSLLIKIKENNIPLKSGNQTDIPNRKIKRIRPNSNNSQARIIAEYLDNNIYIIIAILEKKSGITNKQEIETIKQRIKQYNKDTILLNINYKDQKRLDKEVYDLLNSKQKNKIK